MADLTCITSQLWTGGALANEADVDQLVGAGITVDIDCRHEFDDGPLLGVPTPNAAPVVDAHPTIAYLYDGVFDDGEPKPVSWFADAWTFAEPFLKNGEVVLAHCMAGHNRGPSMCYFLMRAFLGMMPSDAYALLVERRPVAEARYRDDADEAIIALGI